MATVSYRTRRPASSSSRACGASLGDLWPAEGPHGPSPRVRGRPVVAVLPYPSSRYDFRPRFMWSVNRGFMSTTSPRTRGRLRSRQTRQCGLRYIPALARTGEILRGWKIPSCKTGTSPPGRGCPTRLLLAPPARSRLFWWPRVHGPDCRFAAGLWPATRQVVPGPPTRAGFASHCLACSPGAFTWAFCAVSTASSRA